MQLPARHQPLLDGVTQRRAVMVALAPDLARRGVGVRVDVHHRERAVLGPRRAHARQRDRVIATDDERHRARRVHARELGLDAGAHLGRVEGRKGHVAAVEHAQLAEDVDALPAFEIERIAS